MEDHYTLLLVLFPIIFLTVFLHSLFLSSKPKLSKLPPGPKPWPIIGNIHLLGHNPHHTITKLSKIYGPLMSLKLGSMTTIVISSPDIAKEMFVKHDLVFADRKVPHSIKGVNHDKHSIAWLPICPKWRELRKIVVIQLLTNQRLDASHELRRKKVDELIDFARDCCKKGLAIDIGKAVFTTSLNLLSNTFFSIDLASHDSSHSQEFKDLICNLMEDIGRTNLSDFFPLLNPLDLQGVRRRMRDYFSKMFGIFEELIGERLCDSTSYKDDVLGTLLKLVKETDLSFDDVKHMFLDLFAAGTDTTTITVEWAMTELIRHPEKMSKAQAELDKVVISKSRSLEEADISRLPYIQAVVKETMRLHPPGPFLVPRKAKEDAQLCNYYVPKHAQIWVNVWSIGRDPKVWTNPESFAPERFLESEIDMKGRDFELIPFGEGRRICPGIPLAYRMVHLMLATLIHSFNWMLPDGENPEDVNMDEKFGLTLQKVQPLKVVPNPK